MEIVEFALVAITSCIAVMNPTSTVAVYTTLTGDMKSEERLKLAGKAMKISFFVLAFFAFTGQLLFSVFNFTVAAFKIAGGIESSPPRGIGDRGRHRRRQTSDRHLFPRRDEMDRLGDPEIRPPGSPALLCQPGLAQHPRALLR